MARIVISFCISLTTEEEGRGEDSPLVNVSTTEATTHHHAVPEPHGRVAVPGLGQVRQLAGGGRAHHLHRAQLDVSVPGVVVVSAT